MMEDAAHRGESILPFLEAAANGDGEEMMRSLNADPSLIHRPHRDTGSTALIEAAAGHQPESIDHGQHVHSMNGQALTPLMLVLQTVDLFDSLTLSSDYRPVEVLRQLLQLPSDVALLDAGGRSAVSYVAAVENPLRRQLLDVLERCAAPAGAHDGGSDDVPSDTTALLCVTGMHSSAIEKLSSEEASSDGNFRVDLEEPPNPATSDHGGSCRTDLGGRSEPQEQTAFQEVEDSDQTRGGHWRTDPTPQHWTLHSAGKRFPSLPLLHMETSGHDGMLESLWPGDPVQESYSNTLERHLNPNPLREIKYIKGRIWQRLGSSKSSRDSKTFPPLSCSPRSLMPARLKPLSKESSRNEETNSSSVGLKSDNPAKWRGVGQPYEQKLQKSLQSSEDIVLSGDLAQVSLDSCIYSVKQHRWRDDRSSNAGERRSRNGSGREETGIQTSPIDIKPGTCTETGCSQTDHLQLHQPSESFRKSRASAMEKEDLLETKDDTKLKIHDKSKTSEENLWLATSTNEDTKKKTDPQNMDSSRTPKADHISFVHITFSEQKPQTEINYSPSKPLFMKRKMKTVSLLYNVNHSFNVLGQKENTKTKKIRKTRILSAPDSTKRQRPLSNSNRIHGKSVPLPTLVNSSVPSPSKVSKKVVFSAPRSIEQSSQRSQTQLSLYPQKRITSPSTTPILPRSKSSHDFQDIKYSDMFVELSQQGAGPVMYQMFPPTVYGSPCRETNSTSSTRSCSSKASHVSSSRDNSARSKRPKLKNKKDPSAASHSRRNSSSKQEGREKLQNKMENMVIISGEDWEIQTKKQDGDNVELPNVELPTINEATIENSVTITGTVKEIFKMSREMEGNSHNVQPSYPANVDHGLLQEVGEMGCVQQDVGVINSNCHKDMDDNVQGSTIGCTPPSDQDLNATEICPLFKQDEALGDWMYHDSCQKRNSVELKDHAYSLSKNIQKSCSLAGSDYLTADLISCLENLILTDDESSSLVMEDKEDGEQRRKFHEHNEADDPNQLSNIQQVTTNPSLTDQKSHTNICNSTANQPEHNDDSAIHWIKGEVLGRGAYGTVYRGLTGQGELIAAKQVTLHGAHPAAHQKEYKKLQEEVDLLKTLKHVNIVGYLGTSFEDTVVTIFMEYVPGGSISSILRHFGPLQERVISRYSRHILRGIAYLHKNRVVHRDIKGNNVMLMPNGVIKLIDFGCAKRLNGLSINGTRGEMLQSMHGTPYWMAPEVISESGHGEKSDIWSIGCTVFEMATGKPPLAHMERMAAMFYIAVGNGLMPTLPDHFSRKAREFVNLCLTRDQESRPSAEQLLQHPFLHWTI